MPEKEAKDTRTSVISYKAVLVYILLVIAILVISAYTLYGFANEAKEEATTYYLRTQVLIENVTPLVEHHQDMKEWLSQENDENHQEFLASYYESQSNWLNAWLVTLGILLAFVGIVTPFIFMRNYTDNKAEFEKLKDKMEEALQTVGEYKKDIKQEIVTQQEQMQKELHDVKEYVEQAQESQKQAKISELLSDAATNIAKTDYESAISSCKAVLELAPRTEQALFYLGLIYNKLGKHDTAIDYYKQALSIEPQAVSTLVNLGACYFEVQQYALAQEYYEKALVVDPSSSQALANMGGIYFINGEYDKSIEYCLRGLEVDNKNIEILTNLGKAYLRKGDNKLGVKYLNDALLINPKYNEALITLGNFYYNARDYSEAVKYYKRAFARKESSEMILDIIDISIQEHDFKRALEYFRDYQQISNFIYSDLLKSWNDIFETQKDNNDAGMLSLFVNTELEVKERNNPNEPTN